MEVWDSNLLGNPLRSGYAVQSARKSTPTTVLGGSINVRANDPLGALTASVTYVFTLAQMAQFKNFYENSISHGSDWFLLSIRTARGYTQEEVLINDGYDAQLTGNHFFVKMSLFVKKEFNTDPGIIPAPDNAILTSGLDYLKHLPPEEDYVKHS